MKLIREAFRGGHRYWFYCPGCEAAMCYYVGCGIQGSNWSFDPVLMSFTPSLREFYTHPETKVEVTTCHLFIKNGKIEFCGDCPHALNGQTVDLPDFPEGYGLPEPHEVIC